MGNRNRARSCGAGCHCLLPTPNGEQEPRPPAPRQRTVTTSNPSWGTGTWNLPSNGITIPVFQVTEYVGNRAQDTRIIAGDPKRLPRKLEAFATARARIVRPARH